MSGSGFMVLVLDFRAYSPPKVGRIWDMGILL